MPKLCVMRFQESTLRYLLQVFDLELEIEQSSEGLFTFTGLLRT